MRLIRAMIARSREAGYGLNRDYTVVGIWGFGVPLRDRAAPAPKADPGREPARWPAT